MVHGQLGEQSLDLEWRAVLQGIVEARCYCHVWEVGTASALVAPGCSWC